MKQNITIDQLNELSEKGWKYKEEHIQLKDLLQTRLAAQ